jgi:hypothetical protein
MTITLTREEAQQVLDTLEDIADGAEESHKTKEAIETLRAALAQHREWVGLTEGDIYKISEKCGLMGAAWEDVMNAVEAKLKDKNDN